MTDTTFNQSQMDDIAAMMNAIEPGAGAQAEIIQTQTESAAQLSLAGGLELFMLALVLCAMAAFSVPYVRAKAVMLKRKVTQGFAKWRKLEV